MTGKIKVRYDDLLVSFIRNVQNEQFKMLGENLIKNSTNWQTLLHHAAFYNNDVIARHLIEMGTDVEALDSDCKTALTIAIEVRSWGVVKILLEANASIYIIAADGRSILQMVFDSKYSSSKIIRSIVQRLKRDYSAVGELVDTLIDAGCSMYHAAFLKDMEMMQKLLDRGVNINSRGYCKKTALHAAVRLNDLTMVQWIFEKGGDVDAVDEHGKSALFSAAADGKVDLVRLLLEYGANPNTKHMSTGYTPLFAVFAFSVDQSGQENYDECAELLLRHGGIPENSSVDHNTLFDYAFLNHAPNDKLDYLVGQLAILDKCGKFDVKSFMRCNIEEHNSILLHLKTIYESSKTLLDFNVHGELSLFDFLIQSKDTMRIHVRNKMIISNINFICPTLNEIYPYYSRILMKRISEAVAVMSLEDVAIPAFSKIFNSHYNLYYNFARRIVGYLGEHDLKQLSQV